MRKPHKINDHVPHPFRTSRACSEWKQHIIAMASLSIDSMVRGVSCLQQGYQECHFYSVQGYFFACGTKIKATRENFVCFYFRIQMECTKYTKICTIQKFAAIQYYNAHHVPTSQCLKFQSSSPADSERFKSYNMLKDEMLSFPPSAGMDWNRQTVMSLVKPGSKLLQHYKKANVITVQQPGLKLSNSWMGLDYSRSLSSAYHGTIFKLTTIHYTLSSASRRSKDTSHAREEASLY